MIDWFALLVPLAALPIILLFAFVGCALDTEGIPSPLALKYSPGLTGIVDGFEVWFKITGEDGSSEDDVSLKGEDILPEGGFITPFIPLEDIGAEEEGSAEGTCHILMPDPAKSVSLPFKLDKPTGWVVVNFTPPDSFTLTIE